MRGALRWQYSMRPRTADRRTRAGAETALTIRPGSRQCRFMRLHCFPSRAAVSFRRAEFSGFRTGRHRPGGGAAHALFSRGFGWLAALVLVWGSVVPMPVRAQTNAPAESL